MAYATIDDLEIVMRTTLNDTDAAYAEFLLDKVAAFLDQYVTVDDTDTVQASNLKYASLEMVRNVMESANVSDVSSMTQTAGSYSETFTYAAPYSTANMWKLLRKTGYASLLGIGTGIGFARPSYGVLEPEDD